MTKLKRIKDGKVFDCTIVLDSRHKMLKAVFYEHADECAEWKTLPLYDFLPATEGVDY